MMQVFAIPSKIVPAHFPTGIFQPTMSSGSRGMSLMVLSTTSYADLVVQSSSGTALFCNSWFDLSNDPDSDSQKALKWSWLQPFQSKIDRSWLSCCRTPVSIQSLNCTLIRTLGFMLQLSAEQSFNIGFLESNPCKDNFLAT